MLVYCTAAGLVLVGCRYADLGFDLPRVTQGVPVGASGVAPHNHGVYPVIRVDLEPGTEVSLYALGDGAPSEVIRRTFTFTPGDANMDGDIDVFDLLGMLAAFRAGEADLNEDGDTTVQDLLLYLRSFRQSAVGE